MTGRLVADIGGTQARFAVALPNGQITRRIDYHTRDFPSFAAALSRYRAQSAVARGAISEAAVAGAGPVEEGAIKLTNADWVLEVSVLKRLLGVQRATVVNDLAAVAHALPLIPAERRRSLYSGRPKQGHSQLVVGMGTGLGMAQLIPLPRGGYLAQGTEIGHAGWLPHALARRAEPESWSLEHWLCGRGLARLHKAITGEEEAPEVISTSDSQAARRTRRVFGEATAAALRDAALTTGATGRISLVGSVAHALSEDIAAGLAQVLADPHPLRHLVQDLSVELIEDPDPALLGLACLPLE